jgi:hypothetical protein
VGIGVSRPRRVRHPLCGVSLKRSRATLAQEKEDRLFRQVRNSLDHTLARMQLRSASRGRARGVGSYSSERIWFREPGTNRSWGSGAHCRVQVRNGVPYGSSPWLCGAWARSRGRLCQARAIGQGGRCKFHGGESTGPRTVEGRERIAEAQRARWARYRLEKGKP